MNIMDKLKRLITDAVTVWGDPDVRRPFTRRGVSEKALLDGYKRSLEGDDDQPQGADRSRSK
ncbi:MAG TPA: hypothetical protein VGJ94_05185 [Syntrophorhabdaceae bacterium]|jgi:hypothetical protein